MAKRKPTSTLTAKARASACLVAAVPVAIATPAVGWPVTALGHMLVRARGLEDERTAEDLARDFGAGMTVGQRLLALIIMVGFQRTSATAHDLLMQRVAFAALRISPRRLSTVIVRHWPPNVNGWRLPHLHLVIFGRVRDSKGWGETHSHLAEALREVWVAEWNRFSQGWHGAEA